MRRLITPTLQISLGILSLTLSLIFIAYSFGMFPNEQKIALEMRAQNAEALAVQLANLASRKDIDAIKDTIESVVDRHGDVLSIGVRVADGGMLASSKDHAVRWTEPAGGKSTDQHVQVPLMVGDVPAGRIELVFRPLAASGNLLGLSPAMISFIAFIGAAGLVGYYLILKRALSELDPGRAIPERVKAAFDTLAEGVLILNEREQVLLANDAFSKRIANSDETIPGSQAGDLPWVSCDESSVVPEFPWRTAMRAGQSVLGVSMGIRNPAGQLQRLIVNATRIVDGKGIARGVIATFDDVTALHQMNEKLKLSNHQLLLSQVRISEQNQKLWLLASTDPLTGCLNRRTFFEKAERALKDAVDQGQPMSFVMVDADHFKRINDRFGHGVGDEVLVGLADIMKSSCGAQDIAGRYGGEEFCLAVVGRAERDVETLAERLRQAVAGVRGCLPNGEAVTVSVGIASLDSGPCQMSDLMKRADEALYAAKNEGRNRVVTWTNMRPSRETQPGQSAGRPDLDGTSTRQLAGLRRNG